MTRLPRRFRTPRKRPTLQAAHALAFLCVALWAPALHAAPYYDDGTGKGCVSCHNGFQGGNGPLHFQHRTQLGVTSCNLCHPDGGGTTPVRTYMSGPGGGLGCAGCHGRDYGETSPNSGQPKASAYGLREVHVSKGVTSCGTSGCHRPGNLGHSDPFPMSLGEDVAPPYYDPIFSSLVSSCSSADEDMPLDADSVGLDNDGDGLVDLADPDCANAVSTTTTTSSTTTTTLPFACGPSPALGCIAPGKGVLVVNEKAIGKEKLKVSLSKLQAAVTPSQFGDPVTGTTSYKVCVYDGADRLQGEYTVSRAGEVCGGLSCWSAMSDKGFKYTDKSIAAHGIQKIKLTGGPLGKGKLLVIGKNSTSTLPTGVAGALEGQTGATVQILTSDASCFGIVLRRVKKADGHVFSADGS